VRRIECDALITMLFTASLSGGSGLQSDRSSVDAIKPYPGSIVFCTEHVTGAPQGGKASAHISWTGYYSLDSPASVIRYYMKALGTKNHVKEGDENVWRFPLAKPEQVLTVTRPGGPFPLGQCSRPPGSARAIVIMSTMTRPD